nr:PREDICTED: cytochrome P450 4c21-like [Bemisia tabaci]
MKTLQGPPCIPYIGNAYFALQINDRNLCNVLKSQIEKFPNGGYWVKNMPWYVTGDLKVINALLSSSQNIDKSYIYSYFKEHAAGIICANGEDWRLIRRTVNPSFHTSVLKSFGSTYSHHTKTFIEKVEKFADDEMMVDLFVPLHLCTMDFICESMMGCRMNIQKRDLTFLSTNLEKSTEMIHTRLFNVLLQPDLIYYLLGKKQELNNCVKGMHALAKEIVELQTRRGEDARHSKSETEMVPVFMENLLKAAESGIIPKERAVDETVDMIIAGSVTTATTAAWMLTIFAQRPDIQGKAYKEIMETCGGREITMEDTSKFNYLEMVLKETLRHFCIPFISRTITEDLVVDENMTIPAEVNVILSLFVLHHNAENWEKPNEFYPENFSPMNELKRPKGAFLPFLTGPRHCPGSKYAFSSIKFLVANALLRYEFSSDEKMDDLPNASYRMIFMLWPLSGFRAKIKKRA